MRKRKTGKPRPRGPSVRLPLPKKRESRHADRKKYDRAREKERLRTEIPRAPDEER